MKITYIMSPDLDGLCTLKEDLVDILLISSPEKAQGEVLSSVFVCRLSSVSPWSIRRLPFPLNGISSRTTGPNFI